MYDYILKIKKKISSILGIPENAVSVKAKTMEGLGRGFLLALFVIYALLAIPSRSYVQPLIIMSVIPFGIVGAVIGIAAVKGIRGLRRIRPTESSYRMTPTNASN